MKTLHVLGGGIWQLPIVRLARECGHRVVVTDMYRERPAYAHAHAHAAIDLVDREATLAFAAAQRVDGIVCEATDVGVPTAAFVAERLGLPGIGLEVALNFTNKRRMRELTRAAGLPTPRFAPARSDVEAAAAAEEVGFPVIVKPADSQGSRGVGAAGDHAELRRAFAQALVQSRCGEVLVEELLAGTEVTVEGLCVDGRCHVLAVSSKEHFALNPRVASRLTYPAALEPGQLRRLHELNQGVVGALGLRRGITHGEFMVSGSRVHLIEIAARGGANRVSSRIAPHCSGYDVPRRIIDLALEGVLPAPAALGNGAADLCFLDLPAGRVTAIHGMQEARAVPGVAEIEVDLAPGDLVGPPRDDRARPAWTLTLGATRPQVRAATREACSHLRIEVKPLEGDASVALESFAR